MTSRYGFKSLVRRRRFQDFHNFALYYGYGETDKLAGYDVAIVEPAAQTTRDVKAMRQKGTLVLGYVSVMEASPSTPAWTLLQEEDFLTRLGERIVQAEYGTTLVDLRSRRWQGALFHRIGQLLLQAGYDGIFLDTIGDVERADIPLQSSQVQAATELVFQLRETFQEHIFVQNNGLEVLCRETAPYLDGILWENPPVGLPASEAWLERIVQQLQDLRERYGVRMLALFEQDEKDRLGWAVRRRFADRHRFAAHFGPRHYVSSVGVHMD